MAIRIVDVTDDATFALVPPCADPGFDHRSCDYWEDADRGSKAARLSWLEPAARLPEPRALDNPFGAHPAPPANPFGRPDAAEPNPFAPAGDHGLRFNPFAPDDDDALAANPFAPHRERRPAVGSDAPRKLALLGRGLAVFGSYAKVLVADDRPVAYAQFGPLSAYPRA